MHQILAGIQVALALALLACTGLFLRSFWALGAERLGFDTSNALAVRVTMPEAGYGDVASQVRAFERMQARLKAITGVEKVGGVGLLPLAQGLATINFTVTGQAPARVSDLPSANYRLVTTDYFEAMHIAVRQGRDFTDRDDGTHPLVVVVSTALAEAIFHGHNPVGQRLDLQDTAVGVRTAEIIGVVDDVKQVKIEDPPSFDVYVSYRQMDPTAVTWNRYRMFWVARGPLPAVAMAATLRRTIHAEDASVAISSIRTLEQMTDAALAARRFSLVIVGFFAGTALLLTVAGIYSVIAFGVAQRTREFGVRLALGATPKQISGSVFGGGLVIVGFGAPIGILASLLLSRLIATQLYGVSPYDPTALTTAVLVIAIIAFLASWLPARRAAQVNPIEALRAD